MRLARSLRLFAVLILFFLGIAPLPSQTVHAAAFTVNSAADEVDIHPGDGICMAQSGCTLRAAIQEANALAGDDAITIPVGTYTLSIAGQDEDAAATGDLDILASLTINGAGAATTIIDGGQLDRIFHIPSGTSLVVNFSGITLRNGLFPPQSSGASTTYVGGAIFNWESTVNVSNCVLTNNTASAGGGIFHYRGTLTVTDCVISSNTANGLSIGGNEGSGSGAGIFNSGTLVLTRSTITNNTSNAVGGGIEIIGYATITDSTISNNHAHVQGESGPDGRGGGLIITGDVSITGSTISGNTSDYGGGVHQGQGSSTISNSTISGNQATRSGGGAYIAYFSGGNPYSAAVTLTNSTVTGNTAAQYPAQSGVFLSTDASLTARSSVIANNNGANNCAALNGAEIIDGGNNLENGTSCSFGGATGSNTDPLLDLLADNGGPTFTHALLPGSPAINAVPTADCAMTTDQRGMSRPFPSGGNCDIGAVEDDLRECSAMRTGCPTFPR